MNKIGLRQRTSNAWRCLWRPAEESPEQCRPLRLWPRRRTDRLSLPVSPESIADFFKRTEWEYACLFLIETRDTAVRTLANPATKDPADIARLQQEIGTLTIMVGDDPNLMSLREYMAEEVLEFLREQEESKNA